MDYTPVTRAMPPKDVPIEWITPEGRVVNGRYAGGAIWFEQGSPAYIYYTPTYWRRIEQQGPHQ